MRDMGLHGAVRGKKCNTTLPGNSVDRPADLVKRIFAASRIDNMIANFKKSVEYEIGADEPGPASH